MLLQWQTANEVNVSHFNIQRSTNARDFKTVGKQAAQNKQQNNYTYTDELTRNEQQETWFYRIESVDNDGRKQYSEVKQLAIRNEQLAINVFPNPGKDNLTIVCKGMKEFSIVNSLGLEIASGTNLRNDLAIVKVKGFVKGLYIVKVVTANGATLMTKFMKE